MSKLTFDYFHGVEAEQFAFYRIPKTLFTNDYFRNLSSDAKVLYGLMLDRMSLSVKNRWLDQENRVYIIFTLEEIQKYMNCGKDKGVKMLAELDTVKGIGLIERVRQGQGRPALIYIKNFVIQEQEEQPKNPAYETDLDTSLPHTDPASESSLEQPPDPDLSGGLDQGTESGEIQTSEKPKSRVLENRSQEVQNAEVKSSEKPKSRVRKNRSAEFGKSAVTKTEYNKTDSNNINTLSKALEKKENQDSRGKLRPESVLGFENTFEMEMVDRFISLKIQEAKGKGIPPDPHLPQSELQKNTWAIPLYQLLAAGWTERQLRLALDYALTDPFWQTHITNTRKFREKIRILYDKASLPEISGQTMPKTQNGPAKNRFNNFTGRDYDMDKLEEQLLYVTPKVEE